MKKVWIGLLLLAGFHTEAMEQKVIPEPITAILLSPQQFGLQRYDNSFAHALRDYCQVLYFHHKWRSAEKELALILMADSVLEKKTKAERLTPILKEHNDRFKDALLSLEVIHKNHALSDAVLNFLQPMRLLLDINVDLQSHIEKGEEIPFAQAQEIKKELEASCTVQEVVFNYGYAIQELRKMVAARGPKEKSFYDYLKTTTKEFLPLTLKSPDSTITNEKTDTSQKKKKNRKKRKKIVEEEKGNAEPVIDQGDNDEHIL